MRWPSRRARFWATAWILLLVAPSLAACAVRECRDGGSPATAAPTRTGTPEPLRERDYVLIAKDRYRGDEGYGREGYYLTFMVGGIERVSKVSATCFVTAVGAIVPPSCR